MRLPLAPIPIPCNYGAAEEEHNPKAGSSTPTEQSPMAALAPTPARVEVSAAEKPFPPWPPAPASPQPHLHRPLRFFGWMPGLGWARRRASSRGKLSVSHQINVSPR